MTKKPFVNGAEKRAKHRNSAVNVSLAHMSPDELKFIRLYCVLLRKQYYEVKAVMSVMNPSNLGVRSSLQAANVANQLAQFGDDFEAAIAKIKKKHKIKEKRMLHDEIAFLNELADIFALSFFKIVAVDAEDSEDVTLIKDGWCSGEPSSWAACVNLSEPPQDDYQQTIMSQIINFFSTITAWKKPTLNYKQVEPDYEREEYEENDDWYNDD